MDNVIDISVRQKIAAAAAFMATAPLASENNGSGRAELKVEHLFSHGVYARKLYIPKDTVLVGKIHKLDNLNILLTGEISVLVGEEIKRIKAPFVVVSPPGTQRIAYAHEDCEWLTIHGTFETNVDEIEKYFVAQTEQEYLDYCSQQLKLLFKAG